ncbi:TPM domain-containing protein [Singulisphaera rosea]
MRQGLEVVVLVVLSATVCVAKNASGGLGSGVFDEARLFSGAAAARGVESLRAFEKAKRHPIYVVTAESLGGQSPRDRAIAEAGRRGPGGLTILITKKDHRIFVWPDPEALDVFPRSLTVDLSDALLRALRQGQPDEALHAATTILMVSSGAVAKPENPTDTIWTTDVGEADAGQA